MRLLFKNYISLLDRPDLITPDKFIQVAFSFFTDDLFDLAGHHIFITRADGFKEYTKRPWQVMLIMRIIEHPHQYLCFIKIFIVVNPAIVCTNAIA